MSASIDLGAAGVAAAWIGEIAMFASSDGEVFALRNGEAARRQVHDGAILCVHLHPDGARLITGGDDGRLMVSAPAAEPVELTSFNGKWIDHVIASPASGVIVAGVGKTAHVFKANASAPSHAFTFPSTMGGLALDAKGRKLAASHYGGATMVYVLMADDAGVRLNWAGSHLAVAMSPDGEYLLTAMQELELHGWRLPEKTDLRMSGFATKTKSFSWDKRGRWLATSGAACAVIWPFTGKIGPQGKPPLQLGERESNVTRVAFHPREERLAIGYADGEVRLASLEPNAETRLVSQSREAISGLAWRADGQALAWVNEAGEAGAIMLS